MISEQKRQQAPTGIRLPEELRVWLRRQAAENSRSMNQEIVYRLKRSREQEAANERTSA